MSVWALTIQSEPYCPWDLCWQRTDRSKPRGRRMPRKEKLSTQEAVFHLAVTRSIVKGSTRQCPQHGRKQYSILCTEFWGKASLSSLPTVAFLWCLILVWCSGTLSNYWSRNLLLVHLPTKKQYRIMKGKQSCVRVTRAESWLPWRITGWNELRELCRTRLWRTILLHPVTQGELKVSFWKYTLSPLISSVPNMYNSYPYYLTGRSYLL